MKKIAVSTLAMVVALFIAPAAHADSTPGWYAAAGVGATFPIDPTLHTSSGKHDAENEDANVSMSGSIGYAWIEGLRLEGEFYHSQSNLKSVSGFSNAGGHVSNNILFANVLFDFNGGSMLSPYMASGFTPYIGGGIGPDFVSVQSAGASGVGYLKGDTTKFAYQAIAGVSDQLDPNWALTADYRYIASFDPKVDNSVGGRGRLDNASHNVIVGLRYSFDAAPAPMPSAPVAARTPMTPYVAAQTGSKPVVAPVPQSFMVFFDFNKSVITPEAKRIIASAAQEYKKAGFARITVTGHTDTVGSMTYNQKLSERRAAAVEAELKMLGIEQNSIKQVGVGKNELLVPTADGVREAQNRRAEIVLVK